MKRISCVCIAILAARCALTAPTPSISSPPAPIATDSPSTNQSAQVNPSSHQSGGDEYVVIFDPNHPSPPDVLNVLQEVGLHPDHPDVKRVFNNSAFGGFVGSMKDHCINALNDMAAVKYVEKSVKVVSLAQQTSSSAPWGLQQLSQSVPVGSDPTKLQFTYTFDDNGGVGSGVDIYVIDTGINVDHLAFGGRATMGFSKDGPSDLNAASDGDGHGTHVAGTAGAKLFGVATGANLIGVKVLGSDGTGSSSDVIAGLDFVASRHSQRKNDPSFIGSIASMSWSLGSQRSASVEQAISALVAAGIHSSVAAGNEHVDACTQSPSSTGGPQGGSVVVGSVDNSLTLSSFSNTGSCVDVHAPGEVIISTWIGNNKALNALSGTSMACPRKFTLKLTSRIPLNKYRRHWLNGLPDGAEQGTCFSICDEVVSHPECGQEFCQGQSAVQQFRSTFG
jgi:cerevisin